MTIKYYTAFTAPTVGYRVLRNPRLGITGDFSFIRARYNWHSQTRHASVRRSGLTLSAKAGETRNKGTRPEPKRKRARNIIKGELSSVGSLAPTIQWYPGHIAKAERALTESIKMVDVIIEVRDCRIPIATSHPYVPTWVGNKTRVLAMNRADLAPVAARSAWRQHLLAQGENVRFVNAKQGKGIKELKKLAVEAGAGVNEKRKAKGLLPRPVRCLVIGYPNVGKSALINRLVGRNAAKSANKPGLTRNFQWIRLSDAIELLDMPGVIPAKLVSQDTALRLAICDDIGQAAYDVQVVAALMLEELKRVCTEFPGFFDMAQLHERFKVDPMSCSGEEFVFLAADKLHHGDLERTAVRLLTEFRGGVLGQVALESPTMVERNGNAPSTEDIITKRD